MPGEKYKSISVAKEFFEKVSTFVKESGGLYSSIPQLIQHAWRDFETKNLSYKNPKSIKVGKRLIGGENPIYFIAEIGINHNGDLDLAKKMIDLAVEKKCDAVKFQKRTLDKVYLPEEMEKPREVPIEIITPALERGVFDEQDTKRIKDLIKKSPSPSGSIIVKTRDQKRMLEFNEKDYLEIDKYCKEKGIDWFASPWDEESVDFLEKYNPVCYKVASASLTDKNLLKKIKETGKPMIISTGMSSLEKIVKAIKFIGEENIILLHCTSTYPSKDDELDLNGIKTLKKYFNCPIGYSGHEPGIWPSLIAASLGAKIIERHITLGKSMYGSDQAASLDPQNLGDLCRAVKRVPVMLGSEKIKIQESEKPIAQKLRRVDDFN